MKATSLFRFFEEKKHSVRYNADTRPDTDDVATSIYVSKAVLKRPYPATLLLTITDGMEDSK